MASKTKLVFIDKGFQEILSTTGTKTAVQSAAKAIQGRAGSKYYDDVSYYGAGHRYIGFVGSLDGGKDEAANKTLTKAVR